MRHARQPFLHATFTPRTEHGGMTRVGRRKLARPIDPKRPMHVILKSDRAKGKLSLLLPSHSTAIRSLLTRLCRRYDVRLVKYANAGNHLHLLVQARSRRGLQTFLRVFGGQTARFITGARKGRAYGKFWTQLAYSRVVGWGRELRGVIDYIHLNELEAAGAVAYTARKLRRKNLRP